MLEYNAAYSFPFHATLDCVPVTTSLQSPLGTSRHPRVIVLTRCCRRRSHRTIVVVDDTIVRQIFQFHFHRRSPKVIKSDDRDEDL